MKAFRHELGHEVGETLTVAELKDKLDKYPCKMPVMATWEGVLAYVNDENFDTGFVTKGKEEDGEICLIIDVERY